MDKYCPSEYWHDFYGPVEEKEHYECDEDCNIDPRTIFVCLCPCHIQRLDIHKEADFLVSCFS